MWKVALAADNAVVAPPLSFLQVGLMAWHDSNINVTNAKEYFMSDFKRMIDGRYNSPSILQWTVS